MPDGTSPESDISNIVNPFEKLLNTVEEQKIVIEGLLTREQRNPMKYKACADHLRVMYGGKQ